MTCSWCSSEKPVAIYSLAFRYIWYRYSTNELESRERNRHFCVWVTPNWRTPLTLGKWIALNWCPLLTLDSEGTPKFRHNIAKWKTCMKQFYSWSFLENFDDHRLVTYKTSFIFQTCPFFPSLCCLSDTLMFWLIHHSPGYFPAWNCSQRVMNECSALTLPEQRAQLSYTPKVSEYDGFELLQKSLLPHFPYPWNWTSHRQFSIKVIFLRRKKKGKIKSDSVTVILSWCKTQQWGEMGCSARKRTGTLLDKQRRQWHSDCFQCSCRTAPTAKDVLATSCLYNSCKCLLITGTWYTKSGMLFKKQTEF